MLKFFLKGHLVIDNDNIVISDNIMPGKALT